MKFDLHQDRRPLPSPTLHLCTSAKTDSDMETAANFLQLSQTQGEMASDPQTRASNGSSTNVTDGRNLGFSEVNSIWKWEVFKGFL